MTYCIPNLLLDWHQYDGIMSKEPEDKGIVDYFLDKWFVKKVKSTQMAAMSMLPRWEDLEGLFESPRQRRGEIMLEKIDQVCFCVKNCFFGDNVQSDDKNLRDVSPYSLIYVFISVFIIIFTMVRIQSCRFCYYSSLYYIVVEMHLWRRKVKQKVTLVAF